MTTTTLPTPAATPAGPERAPSPLTAALRTLGVAVAVLLVGWAAVQGADWAAADSGEERLSYGAAPIVELVADGAVTVRAGAAGTVEVQREWREGLAPVTYGVEESAERLVVTHTCPWYSATCSAALDVTVPADADVVIRSSDGRIEVAGIAGDLLARTGSGAISVERVGGDVDAGTGSGSVAATGVGGDAELRTGSGGIEARDVGGSLEARSGSGRIEVRGVGGEALARTGSGNILVAGVASDVDVDTSSGRVTVHGNGTPVALDIATSSGRQTVEAPTDPSSPVRVKIRSSSGAVEYLEPLR